MNFETSPHIMKILLVLALLLATAGCASPQRFMPPPAAIGAPAMGAPTEATKPSTGGPFTREREDQEFGQQPNER
jgi:hypothetical protein